MEVEANKEVWHVTDKVRTNSCYDSVSAEAGSNEVRDQSTAGWEPNHETGNFLLPGRDKSVQL